MNNLPMRDIKPLVEIPDTSFYLFLGMLAIIVLAIVALSLFIYKEVVARRLKNKKEALLAELGRVDFSNPKKAAYTITKYGRILATDERSQKIFLELLTLLEKYKYKKEVPPVDEITKNYFNLFFKMLQDASRV